MIDGQGVVHGLGIHGRLHGGNFLHGVDIDHDLVAVHGAGDGIGGAVPNALFIAVHGLGGGGVGRALRETLRDVGLGNRCAGLVNMIDGQGVVHRLRGKLGGNVLQHIVQGGHIEVGGFLGKDQLTVAEGTLILHGDGEAAVTEVELAVAIAISPLDVGVAGEPSQHIFIEILCYIVKQGGLQRIVDVNLGEVGGIDFVDTIDVTAVTLHLHHIANVVILEIAAEEGLTLSIHVLQRQIPQLLNGQTVAGLMGDVPVTTGFLLHLHAILSQ